ncbi:riboflavin synthase [Halocatena pleomorpha]|uniref:Riboflavin synthase n=1 Tax=Halocatena pleomorpha TaxID=1785090 RepID=A0A3P3RJH8_9EURY|nr:riboflavin synthase [Halocatena pleomorpha]RRJ33494.1 riboflavin synthase [Halocatena pleomorpha]
MFTGIVEETGTVVAIDSTDEGRRLRVEGSFADELEAGQSIAVNGCCLTVEDHDADSFELFLSAETIDRTYFGEINRGDRVNLERALAATDRFDGHIVQGHVDATATVTAIESVGDDWTFEFSIPDGLEQYVVEKGSVAVDGISLTVAAHESTGDTADATFTTAIIPTTYDLTTLAEKDVGDPVHIEADVLAKYTERLLAHDDPTSESDESIEHSPIPP